MVAASGRRGAPAMTAVALLLLSTIAATGAGAQNGPAEEAPVTPARTWAVSLRWENDTFGGTDRFYTNGAAVTLSHTGPSWADLLFNPLPWGGGRRTVSYALSQAIFTPEDTDRVIPDPTDRPYAGTLTFGLGLHVDQPNRYDGVRLVVGVVGPWSGAEETQRWVHRRIGSGEPQGWDAQLHNEPILNLGYEHRRKYRLAGVTDGWSVEAIPAVALALGNLLTYVQLGGQVRVGYKIPQDFGTTFLRGMSELPPPRPSEGSSAWESLGVYLHGGIGGSLILHDLTLDGNTFKDSPSVDKRFLVPIAGGGIGIGNRRFLATFSYSLLGKEFEGQRTTVKFGALTVSYFF